MTKSRSRVHTRRGHPPASTGAAAEVDPKGRHLPQLTQVQERTQTQTPQGTYISVALKRHTQDAAVLLTDFNF